MDVESIFLAQIDLLEKQVVTVKHALHSARIAAKKSGDPTRRFYDERPIDAARMLLKNAGGRMKRKEMERLMEEGGINVGSSRDDNIEYSFKLNLKNGNLVQKGEYIELPKES
jgi:hypothetical protein